jgi:hypothetical protein
MGLAAPEFPAAREPELVVLAFLKDHSRSGQMGRASTLGPNRRRLRFEQLEERALLSVAPLVPDLLDLCDTGLSSADNLTNLDNSTPEKTLQFSVGGTIPGATVTLYSGTIVLGSAVATAATTIVTTNGSVDLPDGSHGITARQTAPDDTESADSPGMIVMIDTTAPTAFPKVGEWTFSSSTLSDVFVFGTLAYVTAYSTGLEIIDVTNPTSPVRMGGYNTSGIAYGVAVCGTLAYVADGSAGLQIIDVSSPAAPVRVGGYDTIGDAYGVVVCGTLAYVADGSAGLQIIDVSDPAAPVLLGGYDTGGSSVDLYLSGTLAYVADSPSGLQIIDVSDPAAPAYVGGYDTNGLAVDVCLSGTLAYVADGSSGLQIIDVSDPATPVRVGGFGAGYYAADVFATANRAYVASARGLEIIDVTDPTAPIGLRADGPWADSARGVFVSGSLAYVVPSSSVSSPSLMIVDVTESPPRAPDLQAASDTGISAVDNITRDNTPTFDLQGLPAGSYYRFYRDGAQISGAYERTTTVATYTPSVQADGTYEYTLALVDTAGNVSASSPALSVTIDTVAPVAAATLDLQAGSDTGISDADNLTNDDTPTFDVTSGTPCYRVYRNGAPIGYESTPSYTASSLAEGVWNFSVTAADTAGNESSSSAALAVTIDKSAPVPPPTLLGSYNTTGTACRVFVSGTRAYVADASGGLQIIDIANPAAPVRLGGFVTSSNAVGVYVSGTLAYVACQSSGLLIIDVSNPAAPTLVGSYYTGGSAQQVSVVGTRAYVVGYNGLQILDVSNPAAPVRLGVYGTPYALGLSVSGTLVYVAAEQAGLHILDVSNPAAPVRVGSYDTAGIAFDVFLSGTRAYVADGAAGIHIFDVSDPAAPMRLGGFDTSGNARGVFVAGERAYVADDFPGLQVIDVSAPAAPVRLSGYGMGGYFQGVLAVGELVYIAASTSGLLIVDSLVPSIALQAASDTGLSDSDRITGDSTPTFDVRAVPADAFYRVYRDGAQISGDYEADAAFTAAVQPDGTYDYTVRAVDAAGNVTPLPPALSITIDTVAPAVPTGADLQAASDWGVSDSDNLTADTTPTFDISLPADAYARVFRDGAQVGGDYESAIYTSAALANGTYAFTALAVDVAGNVSAACDPLSVTIDVRKLPALAALDLRPSSDTGVSDEDNITRDNTPTFDLLVAAPYFRLYRNGLPITGVEAGNSYSGPQPDGLWEFTVRGVDVAGNETLPSAPLRVTIDTVSLVAPSRLGGYDSPGTALGVCLSGTLAYVADGYSGLQVVDVSDPAAPARIGGYDTADSAGDVFVAGTLAYVADASAGLQIIDVSNPAAPARRGGYDTTGNAVGVYVVGTLAYVADSAAGLQIIDVSNPAAPVRVGGYDTTGSARSVYVVGKVAYVADDAAGLQVIDVSNPAAPVRVGGYDTTGNAYDVVVFGTLAYVADANSGLQIIDVGNPANPVRVGGYDTPGTTYGVSLSGTLAYLADSSSLQIIDISNNAVPALLANYPTGSGSFRGVVVSGTTAYVAGYGSGLNIVGVTAGMPSSPDLLASSDTGVSSTDNITRDNSPTFAIGAPPSGIRFRLYRDGVQTGGDYQTGSLFESPVQPDGVYVYTLMAVDLAGNVSLSSLPTSVTIDTIAPTQVPSLALQAASDTGISDSDRITRDVSPSFDVSCTAPYYRVFRNGTLVSGYETAAVYTAPAQAEGTVSFTATAVDVAGNESDVSAAVAITIDASAPSRSLLRLGGYDTSGAAYDVYVLGTLAYVADDSSGLQIIDVGDPAAPVLRGSYNTSGAANGVFVVGTLAYVADGSYGLQIIDVSNPAAPVLRGSYNTSGTAYGVFVVGTLAYVADGSSGLQIIDVSNPSAPVRRGSYDTSGTAYGVSIVGTLAYVAGSSSGLQIIDVSNPAASVLRGYYDPQGYSYGVSVVGTLAYVADGSSGLQIIDVSNPAAPVLRGLYDTSGSVEGVFVSGTTAYVADGTAGLHVIDVSDPAQPMRLGGYDTTGSAYGVFVAGTVAYVADYGAGLQVIDLSPLTPAAPDLQAASDTGPSDADNLTSDNTPTFDIDAGGAPHFRVYRNGTLISGYETGTTYTAPVQPDGQWTYTYAAVDEAGNETLRSQPLVVTIYSGPTPTWSSALEHGGEAGEVGLVMAADGSFIESRAGGVRRLVLDFGDAIDPASWSAANVQIAGINASGSAVDLSTLSIATSLRDGNTVGVIEFGTALPDAAKYIVRMSWLADAFGELLAGSSERVFATLAGDVTGNGVVNAADLARARAHAIEAIDLQSVTQIRADVSQDGRVDSLDLTWVRDYVGNDVRGIAAPTLPLLVPTAPCEDSEPLPPPAEEGTAPVAPAAIEAEALQPAPILSGTAAADEETVGPVAAILSTTAADARDVPRASTFGYGRDLDALMLDAIYREYHARHSLTLDGLLDDLANGRDDEPSSIVRRSVRFSSPRAVSLSR